MPKPHSPTKPSALMSLAIQALYKEKCSSLLYAIMYETTYHLKDGESKNQALNTLEEYFPELCGTDSDYFNSTTEVRIMAAVFVRLILQDRGE